MEIELKVTPHSNSMRYYQIHWRVKKKPGMGKLFLQLIEGWNQLVCVWDGAALTNDQPVLFENFDEAVSYAEKLKANPELLEEHNQKQDEIYRAAKERRNKSYSDRNKSRNID
jgi:hypothetical protein